MTASPPPPPSSGPPPPPPNSPFYEFLRILDPHSDLGVKVREAICLDVGPDAPESQQFLLRSGRRSRYYLDKYRLTTNPHLLRRVAALMVNIVGIVPRSALSMPSFTPPFAIDPSMLYGPEPYPLIDFGPGPPGSSSSRSRRIPSPSSSPSPSSPPGSIPSPTPFPFPHPIQQPSYPPISPYASTHPYWPITHLVGPELGAIPLVTAMSLASDLPTLYVRKEAKQYGPNSIDQLDSLELLDRSDPNTKTAADAILARAMLEGQLPQLPSSSSGPFSPSNPFPGAVALIEDVVTTGFELLRAVEILRRCGIHVACALAVADREEGAAQAIAEAGVPFFSLFTKTSLGI